MDETMWNDILWMLQSCRVKKEDGTIICPLTAEQAEALAKYLTFEKEGRFDEKM